VQFAYVLTGGDVHTAQDLVQRALAKVWRRWPTVSRGGNPEVYLRRVIVSEDASWHRRRASTESIRACVPDQMDADRFTAVDAEDAAWRLLAALPRRQRAVLVLRYLEDWPDRQIAEALGCSEATVRSQASRALAALRARLADDATAQQVRSDRHG